MQCRMPAPDADQDVFTRHPTSVNVPRRLSSLGRMNTPAPWAEQLARALLHEPVPRRWAHVQGVASRARSLVPVLGADADLLDAAAWLHDIGYAPGLAVTGLHARTRRRPLPARCPARRRHAVPAGRPSLLTNHRSRRTRTRRHPGPGVPACTVRALQRADVLRHDHQPGRRAHTGRQANRRDTSPVRPRTPDQPVNPARHADDPPRGRASSRPGRLNYISLRTGRGNAL
jgi:hypothetical protein